MKHDVKAAAAAVSSWDFNEIHRILPMFPGVFPMPGVVDRHGAAEDGDYPVKSLDRILPLEEISGFITGLQEVPHG